MFRFRSLDWLFMYCRSEYRLSMYFVSSYIFLKHLFTERAHFIRSILRARCRAEACIARDKNRVAFTPSFRRVRLQLRHHIAKSPNECRNGVTAKARIQPSVGRNSKIESATVTASYSAPSGMESTV